MKTLDRITGNIVLVGFASSGKTATGAALAGLTGFDQVDLDSEVERIFRETRATAMTCREIFRSQGEEAFSALENVALEGLVGKERMILSTGGHAPVPPQNRPLLTKLGMIVYLRADLSTIMQRMHTKGIPATMANQNMEQLWGVRDDIYRSIARVTIDNSRLDPSATAQAIIDAIVTLQRIAKE